MKKKKPALTIEKLQQVQKMLEEMEVDLDDPFPMVNLAGFGGGLGKDFKAGLLPPPCGLMAPGSIQAALEACGCDVRPRTPEEWDAKEKRVMEQLAKSLKP